MAESGILCRVRLVVSIIMCTGNKCPQNVRALRPLVETVMAESGILCRVRLVVSIIMCTGNKCPQNVRALRPLVETVIHEYRP